MLLVGEIEREPDQEPRVRIGGEHGNWMSVDEFVRWDPDMQWAAVFEPTVSFVTDVSLLQERHMGYI